jgi:hypothetical protein
MSNPFGEHSKFEGSHEVHEGHNGVRPRMIRITASSHAPDLDPAHDPDPLFLITPRGRDHEQEQERKTFAGFV